MFTVTNDHTAAASIMRRSDIYWSAQDAMSPPPETVDYREYLAHPDVWAVTALYNGTPVGYVVLMQRTSIGAELHVGFVRECRGLIAKTFVLHTIGVAFRDRGLLKLWAIVPSDNRAAILGAKAVGFTPEGRLRNAMMRRVADGPALRDLLILGLSKG